MDKWLNIFHTAFEMISKIYVLVSEIVKVRSLAFRFRKSSITALEISVMHSPSPTHVSTQLTPQFKLVELNWIHSLDKIGALRTSSRRSCKRWANHRPTKNWRPCSSLPTRTMMEISTSPVSFSLSVSSSKYYSSDQGGYHDNKVETRKNEQILQNLE